MTTAERMVPSVEDALRAWWRDCWSVNDGAESGQHPLAREPYRMVEASSVALDVAVAASFRPWAGPSWAVVVDEIAY